MECAQYGIYLFQYYAEVDWNVAIPQTSRYWQELLRGSGGRVTPQSYPLEVCFANFQIALVYVGRMWVVAGTAGMDNLTANERGMCTCANANASLNVWR